MLRLSRNWYNLLEEEFSKNYFLSLQNFLNKEYQTKTIYPKVEDVFNALNFVKYDDVKVVIFGQDPYHQPNQAHGLSFSVKDGVALPPSLKNIFKEIENEFGVKCHPSGDLSRWAKQGVLLLNTVLTVEKGMPNSHKDKGWEIFIKKIVELLNKREKPIIFVLWGEVAKQLLPLIDINKHIVLSCAHPSPFSAHRGFFGCGHFKKINEILISMNESPIDWRWFMQKEFYYVLFGIILILLIWLAFSFKKGAKKKTEPGKPVEIKTDQKKKTNEYHPETVGIVEKYMYRKEMKMLRFLNECLPSKYITLPKVNLGNLLEPRGASKTTYNYIKDYFVDFVVFEETSMKPLLIVDLYDNSFEDELLKDRAPELVKLLEKIGLKVLSFAYRNNLETDKIKEELYKNLNIQEKKQG